MARVLISDELSPRAEEIFRQNGVDVDIKTGLKPDELKAIIGNYDGLAIRSATKVTAELLEVANTNLKVIGRAGIGVDNVDIKAATNRGIVVMNTPFGNSITTAEHSIAMMMALSRQIPQANASTHAGKWEKSKFMGQELYSKTLGIIGCGNIGGIVADRALGLKMHVVAFDPFLTKERAIELGIEKVELEELLARADFITLHTPLTDKTRNVLNKDSLAKTKKGVRIINCARGGLVDEKALKAALDNGHVAGAALDVFETEPAKDNVLFGHPNVICTPHLGAATEEAQENVAIQVAEQLCDYLINGAVINALNMPSVSAQDAPKLRPYMKLAEQLGNLLGQLARSAVKEINIEYQGHVAALNTKPLTSLILAGFMRPLLDYVNIVSAPVRAAERGITVSETKQDKSESFQTLIRVSVISEKRTRFAEGTLFAGEHPRIVNIDGVPVEAELAQNMLYVVNKDKPGLVGAVGTLLGNSGLNISDMRVGRIPDGGHAICLIALDSSVPDDILEKIKKIEQVERVERLVF